MSCQISGCKGNGTLELDGHKICKKHKSQIDEYNHFVSEMNDQGFVGKHYSKIGVILAEIVRKEFDGELPDGVDNYYPLLKRAQKKYSDYQDVDTLLNREGMI